MECSVKLTGAVVVSVLHEAVARQGAACASVEGLLFGRRAVRRASTLTDDTTAAQSSAGESSTLTHTCVVASALVTGELASFYSHAGTVDAAAVARAVAARVPAGDDSLELVGWWRARAGLPLAPTLRERAVTRGLASAVAGDALVMLVNAGAIDAVHNVGYALYVPDAAAPGRLALAHPAVTNLVDSSNAEYAALDGIALLPADPAVSASLAAAVAPLAASVASVESLFRSALRHVATLSDEIISTIAQIAAVQAEVDALEAAAAAAAT